MPSLNAGVGVGGPFVENDLDAELNLINLNVVSVVHLAKHVVQDMVARNEGRILFTSSIAAEGPAPYEAIYGASKAFVQSFAEAVRYEVKDSGVTVTALMPGPTDTEFFERGGMEDTRVGQGPKDDPADVAKDGFEALMAGKDKVHAGSSKSTLQAAAARVLPDKARAATHAAMTKPKS